MKNVLVSCSIFFSLLASATPGPSLVCRNDQRMNDGPLKEVILTPTASGYLLQYQHIESLQSPKLSIENWAEGLTCRIDAKATLATCISDTANVTVNERREVFLGEEDGLKKSFKYTDISVIKEGSQQQEISFAANDCEVFSVNP